MEGADCVTNESKVNSSDDNELHDSGCEQSPTTPSPSYKYGQRDSTPSTDNIITYDREFLLSLQFSPLALNPNTPELLWSEHVSFMMSNIFNATHSYYTEPDSTSSNGRKEMLPEYFKPAIDNPDVLRPQRNSFQSGCKMRNNSTSESNEKASAPVKSVPGQRRASESKDRPRSVPTVERVERGDRRVGSGRIVLERAESRPDSRGQPRPDSRGVYPNREKAAARPATNADKRHNWRSRRDGEEELSSNSHRERDRDVREESRNVRDNRDHRAPSGYHGNSYQTRRRQDAEPEWFTEDITTFDTIELKGFDGHQEKIEKREKREREKEEKAAKETADKKCKVPQKTGIINSTPVDIVQSSEESQAKGNSNDWQADSDRLEFSSSISTETVYEPTGTGTGFDFNTMWFGMSDNSSASLDSGGSSRFSRWFNRESPRSPMSYSTTAKHHDLIDNIPGVFGEELNADMHMDLLVHDILNHGGTSDKLAESPIGGAAAQKESNDGNRLLHMLQSSSAANAAASSSAKRVKSKDTAQSELPEVLTQLLASPATATNGGSSDIRPELPKEFKTVEELEAGLQSPPRPTETTSKSHRLHRKHDDGGIASVQSKPKAPADYSHTASPQQEMSAFNKLVGLMQVTGELNKTVPKMPEVTNTETPSQLKKLYGNPSIVQAKSNQQAEDGSPNLAPAPLLHPANAQQAPAIHVTQQSTLPQPGLVPALLPQLSHIRNITPPNVGIASSLANIAGMLPNAALYHNGGAPAGLVNMSHMAAGPPIIAAAMHAPAFQGPANPLLQQTMHQRQKLPSPIMFGTQPPVHIVAPAPIHPMAPNQFQQVMNQPQSNGPMGMMGPQNIPLSNQLLEQLVSASMPVPVPKPQPSTQAAAAVSSMAFTPTSVMRKLANDKVDERYRVNDSQLTQLYDNAQGGNAQPQQATSHRLQPQHVQNALQQQQMTMRPIVKNNTQSVAERMLARQLMVEQQNQSQMRQQQAQQMNMRAHQQQQQQQQPPPHHNSNLFQQMGGMNNLFNHQHQPNVMFNHQQQALHIPQSHNQNPGMGPSVSSIQQHLALIQSQQQNQQQQQQMRKGGDGGSGVPGNTSPDIFAKWFCGAEIVGQQGQPAIPKHSAMLHVEDIEN